MKLSSPLQAEDDEGRVGLYLKESKIPTNRHSENEQSKLKDGTLHHLVRSCCSMIMCKHRREVSIDVLIRPGQPHPIDTVICCIVQRQSTVSREDQSSATNHHSTYITNG